MSRCNVYAQVTSDSGRQVGIGGRGSQDKIRVQLNTDNAEQSDCGILVTAEVVGDGLRSADRRKKGSDKRRTLFTVRLPEDPKGWTLRLETSGQWADGLLAVGAALGSLGTRKQASGTAAVLAEHRATERASAWAVAERIILPDGRTLAEVMRAPKEGLN